ncbi:MAG: epoxyqueuosine reductase [Clostridia bacterium]|nr:epoxyqueuosine reductase [Clostridia bacterium]
MKYTQENLQAFALEIGACLCGGAELGVSPIEDEKMRYAFSIAVKLSDAVLKEIDGAPTFSYFQHYRTANALLDQIAFRLANKIEENGFSAFPIAASQSLGKENPFRGVYPHKTAAVLAGLGFVGKSGLFLSEEYGSRVRLATVLTDMPLKANKPIVENGCGSCTACQKACPAGAIYGELPTADGERNFDAEKCSRYMKEHFQGIGRGSVCGVCIRVCPKNKL